MQTRFLVTIGSPSLPCALEEEDGDDGARKRLLTSSMPVKALFRGAKALTSAVSAHAKKR